MGGQVDTDGDGTKDSWKLNLFSNIINPGEKVFIFDARWAGISTQWASTYATMAGRPHTGGESGASEDLVDFRHSSSGAPNNVASHVGDHAGQANILLHDLHVGRYRYQELYQTYGFANWQARDAQRDRFWDVTMR